MLSAEMDFCCFRIPDVARDRPPDAGADDVVVAETEKVIENESLKCILFYVYIFLVCPICLPVFSYFFYNEPVLGVGIDPGMALTPLPSSIGRGLNP
jgi:hypothetical protein